MVNPVQSTATPFKIASFYRRATQKLLQQAGFHSQFEPGDVLVFSHKPTPPAQANLWFGASGFKQMIKKYNFNPVIQEYKRLNGTNLTSEAQRLQIEEFALKVYKV